MRERDHRFENGQDHVGTASLRSNPISSSSIFPPRFARIEPRRWRGLWARRAGGRGRARDLTPCQTVRYRGGAGCRWYPAARFDHMGRIGHDVGGLKHMPANLNSRGLDEDEGPVFQLLEIDARFQILRFASAPFGDSIRSVDDFVGRPMNADPPFRYDRHPPREATLCIDLPNPATAFSSLLDGLQVTVSFCDAFGIRVRWSRRYTIVEARDIGGAVSLELTEESATEHQERQAVLRLPRWLPPSAEHRRSASSMPRYRPVAVEIPGGVAQRAQTMRSMEDQRQRLLEPMRAAAHVQERVQAELRCTIEPMRQAAAAREAELRRAVEPMRQAIRGREAGEATVVRRARCACG